MSTGSVVTKNIGNYEIFAGNPTKKIKNRFSESICEELNKLQWRDNLAFKDLEGIEFDYIEKVINQIKTRIDKKIKVKKFLF